MPKSQKLTPLARNLRQALQSKGLKVADIVRLLPEVSESTVRHWFNGLRQPQLDNLRKLADMLDVSAASLVADDPDYAHDAQEKLTLSLMREASPALREAVLAILQANLTDAKAKR